MDISIINNDIVIFTNQSSHLSSLIFFKNNISVLDLGEIAAYLCPKDFLYLFHIWGMDELGLKLYSQIKTTSNFSNFSILEERFKHYTNNDFRYFYCTPVQLHKCGIKWLKTRVISN